MNKFTSRITVPIILGSLLGIYLLYIGEVSIWTPLLFYFLFGVIANGTIAHRYFSHNSFVVAPVYRWLFSFITVIGAYSTPLFWIIQHRHHHVHTDEKSEIHSPIHGWWQSFIGWRIHKELAISEYASKKTLRIVLKDKPVIFASRYYFEIFLIWILALSLYDWKIMLAGYCVGILIEYIRVGLINIVCHESNFIGNYRTYNTADYSQNNLLLGWFGGGFGWHNNHHRNPTKLICGEKWWEIDIEGYIGWLIKSILR